VGLFTTRCGLREGHVNNHEQDEEFGGGPVHFQKRHKRVLPSEAGGKGELGKEILLKRGKSGGPRFQRGGLPKNDTTGDCEAFGRKIVTSA